MTELQIAFARANAAWMTAQTAYLNAAETAANNPTTKNWTAADKAFQAQQSASKAADRAAQAMRNEAYAAAHA